MDPHANMELRTFFIDPKLDNTLRKEAHAKDFSRNAIFIHYLLNCIAATDAGRASKRALPERILVMRTMHIPVELDEVLRDRAFFERTPRNDLSRRYLRAGMELGLEVQIPKKRRRAATASV